MPMPSMKELNEDPVNRHRSRDRKEVMRIGLKWFAEFRAEMRPGDWAAARSAGIKALNDPLALASIVAKFRACRGRVLKGIAFLSLAQNDWDNGAVKNALLSHKDFPHKRFVEACAKIFEETKYERTRASKPRELLDVKDRLDSFRKRSISRDVYESKLRHAFYPDVAWTTDLRRVGIHMTMRENGRRKNLVPKYTITCFPSRRLRVLREFGGPGGTIRVSKRRRAFVIDAERVWRGCCMIGWDVVVITNGPGYHWDTMRFRLTRRKLATMIRKDEAEASEA